MLKTVEEIGRVVQNAHFFNPRNWSREVMSSTAETSPLEAVRRFFALLTERQVNYVLVGGIALLYYVEGRNTQDLDLIIAAEDLDRLSEIEIVERDVYFARGRFQGLRVDFLLTDNPLFRRVQRAYVRRERFLGQAVPLATVEGLLLLKLYALPSLYRQGDFVRVGLYENDIAVLVYEYEPDMERLLDIIAEYVGQGDLTSLREIVAEIEERVRRFKGEKGG
ncbi:MAG: hypothetical protein D6759_03935 [Chloroflexi bacterium]|nr:MAG: hypothetical protein D6759_03935 [Chloroflexota bacterium]